MCASNNLNFTRFYARIVLKGKLNIAHGQCCEPEKSRVCSIWFVWKNGDILVTASLTYMWLHVWAPLRVIKTLTLSLVKNSPQVLSTKLIYSGTLLIQWPVGPKNLPVLTGWPYYRGRLKVHALRAGNDKYTKHLILISNTTVLIYQQPESRYRKQ